MWKIDFAFRLLHLTSLTMWTLRSSHRGHEVDDWSGGSCSGPALHFVHMCTITFLTYCSSVDFLTGLWLVDQWLTIDLARTKGPPFDLLTICWPLNLYVLGCVTWVDLELTVDLRWPVDLMMRYWDYDYIWTRSEDRCTLIWYYRMLIVKCNMIDLEVNRVTWCMSWALIVFIWS